MTALFTYLSYRDAPAAITGQFETGLEAPAVLERSEALSAPGVLRAGADRQAAITPAGGSGGPAGSRFR
jgi:hypothetical protein